jgi:SAM-dependent methyltransferase
MNHEALDETVATKLPSTMNHEALYETPTMKLPSTIDYEALYETQARTLPSTVSIGGGDFDEGGQRMLGVLLMEGLKPDVTLVDFGCGTGRMAVHAIPWLKTGGRYIGIDISTTMLAHARKLIDEKVPSPLCSVEFIHQTTPDFSLPEKSVDMLCVFSVFTHMEHEDSFRYLRDARRIIKDDGKLIYSCLTMDLAMSRVDFLQQANLDVVERWAVVRNVTTTREMMDTIAEMAGWKTVRWYHGDEPNIQLPNSSEMRALGQSICVLAPA